MLASFSTRSKGPPGFLLLTLVGLVACAGGKDEGGDSADQQVTPGDDGGADGADGGADGGLDLAGLDGAVWGVANLDDDDEDGEADFGLRSEDDELVSIGLSTDAFSGLGDGSVSLTLLSTTGFVQVWADGELVLVDAGDSATVAADVDPTSIMVEFGDFAVSGELELVHLDGDGAELASTTLGLHSAPLILNHHMQQALTGAAVEISLRSWGSNEDMIADFVDRLGGDFVHPDAAVYDYDVWVQDELEFGTSSVPGKSIDVVIDSIRAGRSSALDDFPEDYFFGPDEALGTWGTGRPTSQDSFGNLEISPPVTVDGVEYPFGRIYFGDGGRGLAPADEMQEFLVRQEVQAPFTLDIGWLCVGHVDEFTTFLPDPTAPRGFRLYVADIDLGYAFLESLDPDLSIPQYRDHGFSTVGDILNDASVRNYNVDLQVDEIEPNIETLIANLALTDDEVVRVPGLFERSSECAGYGLALIPATVNMAVWTAENGVDAELFIPDPFLRTDVTSSPATDPLVMEFEALLPSHLTNHWVDDWDIYHIGWGEVHCGTNIRREQPLDWWSVASHLVEVSP